MAMRVHDETSCGPLCQHPACWQSNLRQDKGFPKLHCRSPISPDIELDLPTLKVCNMLEDFGDDPNDKYPARYGGRQRHERSMLLPDLHKTSRQSIKITRAPQTSPKSSSNGRAMDMKNTTAFKVVEVQEVFDPEDLQGTWDDTFLSKSYYVWVPNKKKKKRRKKRALGVQESGVSKARPGSPQNLKFKDVTEDMVPKEIEDHRLTAKKKRAMTRSPTGIRHPPLTPRTPCGSSSKMEFDHEGSSDWTEQKLLSSKTGRSGARTHRSRLSVPVPTRLSGWYTPGRDTTPRQVIKHRYSNDSISELLDLPRDILVQVLESTRQSDLMSRDKMRKIIDHFLPPQLERGNTNISLASNDLLQQKKLNLHEGNKNLRQPQLMETKPVFYLDDDVVDEEEDEDAQRSESLYGSLKDLYFGGDTGRIRDFGRYKKPLPSITGGGRAVSAGDTASAKIPSISLGLPELPSGIRQTKAFTYSKKIEYDFTLEGSPSPTRSAKASARKRAPVPTPPTSVRSNGTPGSDHGTTIRVNIPSQTSHRSGDSSQNVEGENDKQQPQLGEPLHAVSPTFSTRVPNAPATTPATYHITPTMPKSAPLMRDRDASATTLTATPQDWPPVEKGPMGQPLRAPVNTPGSLIQEQSGLGTIQESVPQEEYTNQPHPVSRGRSVRFEIPEIPPPPSSPQLSEKESLEDNTDQSRNAVTVNTIIPKETPSTSTNYKPMSGHTIHTDANTINTSLQAENSFMRSTATGQASISSSPEPWPQVREADYDVAPVPSPVTSIHDSPDHVSKIEISLINTESNENRPETLSQEVSMDDQETTEPGSDYINKIVTDAAAGVKKLMEESRKSESPAPPPPSPEPKEDSDIKIINKQKSLVMTPVIEEEVVPTPLGEYESTMTVMQISPKGGAVAGTKRATQRQMDTFVNIDIPASFETKSEASQADVHNAELENKTIPEETEPTPDDTKIRDMALSVQSTLAARTISEQAYSEVSSSMIEPAMSQASQGPALSEDLNEQKDKSELLCDWSGVVIGSDAQDTMAMLSSKPDMTEDGGDHEGFKDDLRQEYERLKQETESDMSQTENK